MKLSVKLLTCCVIAICAIWPTAEAGRVSLRPLSAREVRQVLRAAGREDAIPDGRSISSGLAVIKGVGLGIKKGVAGSLLFDLATSNATMNLIGNLFNSTSNGSSSTTQEICFSSRSVDGDQRQARQATGTSTPTTPTTIPTTTTSTQTIPTSPTTETTSYTPTTTTETTPTTTTNGMTCLVLTKPYKARKRRDVGNSRKLSKTIRKLRKSRQV